MTYAEQVVKLASEIAVEAERLAKLEKSRSEWVTPLREWVTIGDSRHYVVGKDGKVAAGLEGSIVPTAVNMAAHRAQYARRWQYRPDPACASP